MRWVLSSGADALAPDLVPGAQGAELQRLAALGALARELAGTRTDTWPEPLAAWARSSLPVAPDVAEAAARAGGDVDVLAMAYEKLISGVSRRQLGTFFTPRPIVAHIVEQISALLPTAPAHVIDPGAGVGAFSLAALEAWPDAVVSAVDVNVPALGLLAARAPHQDRLRLVHEDYLAWLGESWPALTGPRLVLGNPPYVRHQAMSAKAKEAARSAAGDLVTSGLCGLSTYFLAGTLRVLAPDDALALLLPGSWCEARYGREIREWLWRAHRRQVQLQPFPSTLEVFPGTQVTAMILLVGPERADTQPIAIRQARLADAVRLAMPRVVDRRAPCPPAFTDLRPAPRPPRGTLPLGEVVRIRRQVATGAVRFFFLTDDDVAQHCLPQAVLRRALVKAAHCPGAVLDVETHDSLKHPRWLLDLNGVDPEVDAHVARYLARGVVDGVPLTHLARVRPLWHTVEQVAAPDVFVAPVGSGGHRIISNTVAAVGSNNLYGLYVSRDAPWTATELAEWLSSEVGQRRLAEIARHYQGGSLKIEPRALRYVAVPRRLP